MFLFVLSLHAQDADTNSTHAGYVPVISGGLGYIYNVNAGTPSLLPQINPVLTLPLGSHFLVESRSDFTGFFQRSDGTSGPYTGKVFKSVDYAQVDWLANSHVIPVFGRYILPFGLYPERLVPLWIANFQDTPIDYAVGTRTSGSGDGGMLRGVIAQTNNISAQYSAYFSAHSNTNELQSARTTGADGSVYFENQHVEVGGSYQRFLEGHHINNGGIYVAWQPPKTTLDVKAEYDRNFNGNGYWIEPAYRLSQIPVANSFFRNLDFVTRIQQFRPLNGGGNGLPTLSTERVDVGLNYYFRDNNWRVITDYGRLFNSQQDHNVWNVGFTYRFLFPLWRGRK